MNPTVLAPSVPYFHQVTSNAVVDMIVAPKGAQLHFLEVSNPDAADYFMQFFDLPAADVTLGVTVPNLSLLIPAGDGALHGAMDKPLAAPVGFKHAISYAITTLPTGTVGPTGPVNVNAGYRYTPTVPGEV